MRLYRRDDSGEPVRDIQDRLAALGFESDDEPGSFGEGTFEAVSAFQRHRGLRVDGIVGPETWRVLYEAGYRLGDRLLFLRRPMLRGDDVGELQERLNHLGFETGRPDGIYGPQTAQAVSRFQSDRGLAEDGVGGPEVVTELRLVTRGKLGTGRETVREREWMRTLPRSVVGTRVYFDPAGRSPREAASAWEAMTAAALSFQDEGGLPIISRSADVVTPERVRARRANRLGAELVIGFQFPDPDSSDRIYFFESGGVRSEAGALFAIALSEVFQVEPEGRATPLLRETRAAAAIISLEHLDTASGFAAVEGIKRFFGQDPDRKRR